MKKNENIVASCVRIEQEKGTGDIFLVFKIIDSDFKKRIRENWTQNIELKILGQELYEE